MATGFTVDGQNRPVWSQFTADFRNTDSWTDRGERTAVAAVADRTRDQPILDVGVGGGRSAWFLRLISADYVAVDYTPDMVELCRANMAGVDVRLADARDLSMFDSASFGLVVFSFNGLDAIDHAGRQQALAEMHRVLRPGGLLLFSTLNKDGPGFREAPWQVRGHPGWPPVVRAGALVALLPTNVGRYRRTYGNWWGHRHHGIDEGGWGMSSLSAHEFSLVVHFTTLHEERRELAAAGFELEAVWADETGAEIDLERLSSSALYHHLVARKV